MTEYEKINRRFEKFFFNRVKKTIDFKEVIAIIERSGIEAAVTYVTNDLANPELAKEIERLYGVVGLRHANRSTRALRILEKKGFGFNEEWVKFIQEYLRVHLIEKITFAVNATTRDFLLRVLQQSISEGWGVDKTVRNLRESGFSDFQAARIVRTEVNTAANVGVIAAGQTYEYEMLKEWIAINDSRTRGVNAKDHADHIHLDGVTIDFDDYFTDPKNGVRLFQPGDPKAVGSSRAVASTVINCRCNLALKPKRDQRGRLIPRSGRNKPVLGFPNRPLEPIGFSQAATIEEAENRIRALGIGKVSLKGYSIDIANGILEATEMEHSISPLTGLKAMGMGSRVPKNYRGQYKPGTKEIELNKDYSLIKSFPLSYETQVKEIDDRIKKVKDEYLGNPKFNQSSVTKHLRELIKARDKKAAFMEAGNSELHFSTSTSAATVREQAKLTTIHEIGHFRHMYQQKNTQEFKFDPKNVPTEYAAKDRYEYYAEWYTVYRAKGEAGIPKDLLELFKKITWNKRFALAASTI